MLLMIGSSAAWAQSRVEAQPVSKETSASGAKIDRASAYYHYGLARLYAERAAASFSPNREYLDRAIEHYKAAIKADPEMPMLVDELADLEAGHYTLFLWPLYPGRSAP